LSSKETITVDLDALADVLASVDGYCGNCQTDLAERMEEAFPGHEWYSRIAAADGRHDAAIDAYRAAKGLPKVP
jgi:hypothetical protein